MDDVLSSFWDSEKIAEQNWEETSQNIDEYIELSEWKLIDLDCEPHNEKIAFLDGVLRLDTEVFDINTKARIKLFSLASGICELIPRSYNSFEAFKSIKTKKIAIPDKDINHKKISIREYYDLLSKETNHLSILKATEQESLLDYKGDAPFIIWDGSLPITFRGLQDKHVFGLIKSHRKYFMDDKNLELTYNIKTFQRTPIIHYTSQDTDKFYYTWYTTLNSNITGLVRIEILADMDIQDASKMANDISCYLRFFASDPIYEERAPQNLAPISALETYLRAYIGYHFVDKPKFL